ncbi:MAG TPA: LPS export ABC transporter periplasmic protein LptC [Candidatus Acidoferrales bacterium]
MKRPPIEQIRRLVLVALIAVIAIVVGNYALRRWRAQQARESVPATVPTDVRQQAERFTFSRSEGGQTLFNVEAQRTTERAGKTTVLENVFITIYGRSGERADEIRTPRCEYDVEGTGQITCPEEVVVHLRGGSAGIADYQRAVILTTAAVHFDPAASVAWTDQPVRFEFPNGRGQAVGLRYQAEEPAVRFEREVRIEMAGSRGPVNIRGAELHFFARAPAFELLPPLEVTAGEDRLAADRLRLELDSEFQARRIDALGNVAVRSRLQGRPMTARAAQAAAEYASDGGLERLRAAGQVFIELQGAASREQLTCAEAVFFFEPARREVERMTATGDARLVSTAAGQTRELRAATMELRMAGARQVLTARPATRGQPAPSSTGRATLVIRKMPGEEQTIVADQIELQFEDQERLRALAASGSVEMKQTRPNKPAQTTSSDTLQARFDASGRLSEAEQQGKFRYRDDRWQAEAGRASFQAATGIYRLREQPAFWDSSSRTTAREIELDERAGELRAEGSVLTAYRDSARDKPGFGDSEPVNISAERLRAEQNQSRARYQGKARLWQGQSRLAADVIDLYQNPKRLVAEGNVSGVFLDSQRDRAEPAAKKRQAVEVASERFTFTEADHRGLFEGNVRARNGFGRLRAPELEVYLGRAQAGGDMELQRALARGGVVIEREGSQALGEQAEYSAAAETVTLWGGEPRLVDPERGTTAGDRLTLFLPDGTIRVDSAEGTRTVTRRPWTR